jgi:hypothetical protein
MASLDKELEALRKEHQQLSDHISRFALISLTILFIFVLGFSRACSRINGKEVRTRVDKITAQSNLSGRQPDISYVFILQELVGEEDGEPEASPTPCGQQPAQVAAVNDSSEAPPQASPAEAAPEAAQAPTPATSQPEQETEEERKRAEENQKKEEEREKQEADEEQTKQENELEGLAQTWFYVSVPLLPSSVTIDLRYWIFSLPLIFWFSGLYLYILSKKQALLRSLAAYKVQSDNDSVATNVDRLLFNNDPARESEFSSYPSRLATYLYVAGIIILPLYLIIVGEPFWIAWNWSLLKGFAKVPVIITFYIVAYCLYVSVKLNQQLTELTGWSPAPNPIVSLWNESRQVIRRLLLSFKPQISLTTGSLLTLVTLFTLLTKDCTGKPYKGYQFALLADGSDWIYNNSDIYHHVARILYVVSIVLAIFTLVVVVIPKIYSELLANRRVQAWLFVIAGTISLFLISDFSLDFFPLLAYSFIVKYLIWLVPTAVWYRYILIRGSDRPDKWERIRALLIIFYLPLFFNACIFLFRDLDLCIKGLPIYFISAHLLAIGYMQIARRQALTDAYERDNSKAGDKNAP